MKRLISGVATAILLFSACSSGGNQTQPDVPDVEPVVIDDTQETITKSLDYTPELDGFSFENFGGGEAPAALTVNMVRRLYGDHQVCSEVVDNQCTPYPVVLQLIQQANRSMAAGLCEGFAVLTLRLANDTQSLNEYQAVSKVSELVKDDPRLLSELAYWYTTQFAFEVAEEAEQYLSLSPAQIAETLSNDFSDAVSASSVGYTLGLYSEAGGHAVTPYRVDQVGNQWRIYIYDSNWPNQERWIDVDGDQWSYDLAATNPNDTSSGWSGSTGTMELTPMTARKGPFTCPFCPNEGQTKSGTLLTVAATGDKQVGLQITDSKNNRLGWFDGVFVNEIEGASYRYLISRGTADPVLVYLPPEVETYSADVAATTTQETSDPGLEPAENSNFSLLVLDEERSVQIEAPVSSIEEPVSAPETDSGEPDQEERESLISWDDDGEVEIEGIEGGSVEIAVEDVSVEIDTTTGQDIEFELDSQDELGEEQDIVLEIDIVDSETNEILVETEVEAELDEDAAPVEYELTFDAETGEITTEADEIEAWVASDAEFYQALATGTVEEVLGDTWIEELAEDDLFIIVDPDEEDFEWGLVEDDYWDDDYWEPDDYDADYYIEEAEEWEEFEEVPDDDPFLEPEPTLIGEEEALEETLLNSYTTNFPQLSSVNTTRMEEYTDVGGTLTETWVDTQWTEIRTITTWEEIQSRRGLIQTFLTGEEISTVTSWETEVTISQIPIQETQTITTWMTEELVATVRDCLWREDNPPTIGTTMMVTWRNSMTNLNLQVPKPSGCATPSEPVVTTEQTDQSTDTVTTTTQALDSNDGYWYETTVTDITVSTTYVDTTVITWSDGFVDTQVGDPYTIAETSQATAVNTIDCGLTGGWNGIGTSCVADIDTFGQRDTLVFTITETKTIEMVARSSLTCGGWPDLNGEGDYGDPYIYLVNDSTGAVIQQDDDGGCTCGTECGDSGNCWDSAITRELNPGTYRLELDIYNQQTNGYYNVTIQEVTQP
jgi:hypothetical protein